MNNYNVTRRTLFLFALFCMAGLLALSGCRARRLSKAETVTAFKKYVMSPIPMSVTNIKADQPKNFGGYRYTFRFNINRDDVGLLINSRPFVKVWNVKYKNGDLSWQWNCDGPLGTGPVSSMPCYDHTREPGWFKPGLRNNPEVYAFWKKGDLVNVQVFEKESRGPTEIRVLLYNGEEAEAYFVVYYSEK
jgi:hypothetical protein